MSSISHHDPFMGYEYQPYDFTNHDVSLPKLVSPPPPCQDRHVYIPTSIAASPGTSSTPFHDREAFRSSESLLNQNNDWANPLDESTAQDGAINLISNTTLNPFAFTSGLEYTTPEATHGLPRPQSNLTGKAGQTQVEVRNRVKATYLHRSSSGRIRKPQHRGLDPRKVFKGVNAACSRLLELTSGRFPTETEIFGFNLTLKTSIETLNQWVRRHALKDNESKCQLELPESILNSLFQNHQGKCRPLICGDISTALEKVEDRPYACTHRCGRNFQRKDDWRKHEELNFPQEVWLCREGNCQALSVTAQVHFRRNKFREHLLKHHHHVQPTKEGIEFYRFPIGSKFPKKCIFIGCPKKFNGWR